MHQSNLVILQLYGRTPPPCRDYCGLTITHSEVILNVWRVSFGPHVYPKRTKCHVDEFQHDKNFQMEIERCFDRNVVEYVNNISKKKINLQSLPTKVFLSIVKFLAVRDIRSLSQASKILFNRCNMDNVWKIFFSNYFNRTPERNDMITAQKCGWKEALRQKLKKLKMTNSVPKASGNFISAKRKQEKLNNLKNQLTTIKSATLNKPKIVNSASNPKSQFSDIKIAELSKSKIVNVINNSKSQLATIKPAELNKAKVINTTSNTKNPFLTPKITNLSKLMNANDTKTLTKSPQSAPKIKPVNVKLDATRSMSVLDQEKVCKVRINPTASTFNLSTNTAKGCLKKTLPQVKNDLKLNKMPQFVNRPDVKIQIPVELKKLIASNKKVSLTEPNKIKNVTVVKK